MQTWGDSMPRKKKLSSERLNLTLSPDESKKLNDYCLAVANRQGKMPYFIKTKIGRLALDEWLENHSKDFAIDFDQIKP